MALQLILNQRAKRHRFLGILLIGLGSLIILYLGLVKFSFSNEEKLDVSRFAKETQSSFAQVLGQQKEADPGLDVSPGKIASFGSLLGLKQNNNGLSPATPPLEEFSLSVPKLQIKNARVKTNTNGTSKDEYLPILKEAVAHFKGTALPGEAGNVFLFGHSMLPILAHGQYESIFTNLPKLRKSDIIKIKYGEKELTYQVEQTGIVDPQDVFVLTQSQVEQKVTLMTCIPPGFGEKRFVVIGKLVSGEYLED